MNVQLFQIIHSLVWCFCIYSTFKLKGNLKLIPIAIALIAFFVSPVRFEEKRISHIETRSFVVPEKIEVKTKTFKEKQLEEHNQLKSMSKGIQDEIN